MSTSNNNNSFEILFFSVWRNLYLNTHIFNFISLYYENQTKEFDSLKEIEEYEYKEYIESLRYYGDDEFIIKDYSRFEILKEIDISNSGCDIAPNLKQLPNTIVSFKFQLFNKTKILASSIPSSITNLQNAYFKKPFVKTPFSTFPFNDNDIITKSITSLSFSYSFDKSIKNYIFPKSLTSLKLGESWDNGMKVLKEGDLPFFSNLYNLKKLNLGGYNFFKGLNGVDVFPATIEKLKCSFPTNNFILSKGILSETNIKCLKVISFKNYSFTITKDSFPSSLNILKVKYSTNITNPELIPPNVKLVIGYKDLNK